MVRSGSSQRGGRSDARITSRAVYQTRCDGRTRRAGALERQREERRGRADVADVGAPVPQQRAFEQRPRDVDQEIGDQRRDDQADHAAGGGADQAEAPPHQGFAEIIRMPRVAPQAGLEHELDVACARRGSGATARRRRPRTPGRPRTAGRRGNPAIVSDAGRDRDDREIDRQRHDPRRPPPAAGTP